MPFSKSGKEVMGSMVGQYGAKKGKQVFYATMNKMHMKNKWEGPKPKGKCEMNCRPMEKGGEPCSNKFTR